MTTPARTRRLALLALGGVCALVLGGLAWATRSAIQLERLEDQAARERSLDESRALALAKLDALIEPVLGRETARPYEYFRPFYKPVGAVYEATGADASGAVLLPSPLRGLRGPDWVLLHFQASEYGDTQRWSSPQVTESGFAFATPVYCIPPADRVRHAAPEQWLATLAERYRPLELLQRLEEALGASASAVDSVTPEREPSRTVTEFIRRGARLVQMQREGYPGDICYPQTVAFENLDAWGRPDDPPPPGDCVEVSATPMKPIWLDLTMDGRRQLAFVRSVSVETSDFCTLQGVLIDWERLRVALEAEVRDLFPRAAIVPLVAAGPTTLPHSHAMMQTIPARLDLGLLPPGGEDRRLSTGLRVGLVVAWGTTLLALAAVVYGLMKYLADTERRIRFVAAVTHELRTPLTSFQLYADLLGDMPREDADQRRRYAATLRTEARRLGRLVENVLAYSRIGDALPAVRRQTVRPAAVLEQVRGSATAASCIAAGKTLVVEDRCPSELALRTDVELLVQVLMNLLENACKYSVGAADPRVWLTARVEGREVVFEVDDDGPGVAADERRAVFIPFRRGKGESVKSAGGLGLGLALSRYWASCLGGQLTLRRSPRNGSRFTSFLLSVPLD